MQLRRYLFFILTLALTSSFLVSSAMAEGIQARMKARLPVIKALKSEGIIGENNRGFLEFVGNKKKQADVMQAENKDRQKVYAAIAKKQGVTAEVVGKRRALQIMQNARLGEWLQNEQGQWYQKK
ncbi:MAG: YdbL family protein [Desulfobacterales bacterium]|nr:YdbL family protein [Desulfobacterales bacterium]